MEKFIKFMQVVNKVTMFATVILLFLAFFLAGFDDMSVETINTCSIWLVLAAVACLVASLASSKFLEDYVD